MLAAQPQRQPEIEEVGRRNLPWQGKVKCQACPRALPVSLLGGSNSCGDLGEDKPPLANLAPSPPRHCSPSAFPRAVGRVLCVGLPGGGAGGRKAPGRNCTESFEPPPELSQAPACSTEQAGSPRLSLPSPLFAMHSRSLCPGSTEALPSPDFSLLPSHPSAWFLAQPAPVSPLPLPILAGPPPGRCALPTSRARGDATSSSASTHSPQALAFAPVATALAPTLLPAPSPASLAAPLAPKEEKQRQCHNFCRHRLPLALPGGGTRARCPFSRPSHPQIAPKKQTSVLLSPPSSFTSPANPKCWSPCHGNVSTALQDGVNQQNKPPPPPWARYAAGSPTQCRELGWSPGQHRALGGGDTTQILAHLLPNNPKQARRAQSKQGKKLGDLGAAKRARGKRV